MRCFSLHLNLTIFVLICVVAMLQGNVGSSRNYFYHRKTFEQCLLKEGEKQFFPF